MHGTQAVLFSLASCRLGTGSRVKIGSSLDLSLKFKDWYDTRGLRLLASYRKILLLSEAPATVLAPGLPGAHTAYDLLGG